jgi:hypothetical protein
MGFGKEEGIDHGALSWSNGPCELPVLGGCLSDIACRGNGSELVDPIVLGKVEMFLIFMIHWISWNGVRVDEGEGFDRKRLLDRRIGCGLCDSVAMDRQHDIQLSCHSTFHFLYRTSNVDVRCS